MNFKQYQKESKKTALYRDCEVIKGNYYIYPILGLAGESGEVVEKFKKVIRNDNGKITPEFKETIKKELGDVLWYLAQICTELNINFDEVATGNIEKLQSRLQRGVIKSAGDNR